MIIITISTHCSPHPSPTLLGTHKPQKFNSRVRGKGDIPFYPQKSSVNRCHEIGFSGICVLLSKFKSAIKRILNVSSFILLNFRKPCKQLLKFFHSMSVHTRWLLPLHLEERAAGFHILGKVNMSQTLATHTNIKLCSVFAMAVNCRGRMKAWDGDKVKLLF